MVKYVTAYASEDGTLFLDRKEAERYDLKCKIMNWYNDAKLVIDNINGEFVAGSVVADWLLDHRDDITKFLGTYTTYSI